jgi:hypothetical protein
LAETVCRLPGSAWAMTVAALSCCGNVSPTASSIESGSAAGDSASEEGAVTSDAAADDGPADGSSEPMARCGNPCPISEPIVGDPCDFRAECEYGKSPFVPCNRVFVCTAGRAAILSNSVPDASVCSTGLSAGCPASRAAVETGAPCAPAEGLQCAYADDECDCIQENEAPPTWVCSGGSNASGLAGCPVPRAKLGTPCSSVNESCQQISSGVYETCSPCGNQWGTDLTPGGNGTTLSPDG